MKVYSGNKKSLYSLIVLGVLAGYMVYSQLFSGPTYKPVTPQTMRPAVSSDSPDTAAPARDGKSGPNISQAKGKVGRGSSSKKNGEFHPVVLSKKPEDRPAVGDIDPTIRFDLLDKVMKIPQAGGERDLFQISKTPPAKQLVALTGPETIVKPFVNFGPKSPPPPPPPPGPPPPPPPMQIPFKFYGTSAVHPDGKRTAYFIIPGATPDADEIFMADEGTVIKNRFRILQIGVDKVVVQDVTDKRQQPLNMEKENTQ